jgi:hypothetical protein
MSPLPVFLLDTHALYWHLSEPTKLSAPARQAIVVPKLMAAMRPQQLSRSWPSNVYGLDSASPWPAASSAAAGWGRDRASVLVAVLRNGIAVNTMRGPRV